MARALRYVRPLWKSFTLKVVLSIISLMPPILFPWLFKILIDHVVLAQPILPEASAYPSFVIPFLDQLRPGQPTEIAIILGAIFFVLLILVGGFGTNSAQHDIAHGSLARGQDTATGTENEANTSWSFASGLFGIFEYYWTLRLSQSLNHRFRYALFQRLLTVPMETMENERIGDAIYRVMYDTPAITIVLYQLTLAPIVLPMQMMLIVWMFHSTYGEYATILLLALAIVPIIALVTFPFAHLLRERSLESRQTGATTTSTIEVGVTSVRASQSLDNGFYQNRRFDLDSWTSFSAFRDLVKAQILMILTGLGCVSGLVLAAFLYVSDLVIDGSLTPGDFTVVMIYFGQLGLSSWRLGTLWIGVQKQAAGLHRVFELMDSQAEKDDSDAVPVPPISQGVRFEKVAFVYPNGTAALRDVSIEARVGETTALIGPSGAGKTTLVYLISRFLRPTAGRLLIDGIDLDTVSLSSLRRQIAFVLQEPMLFDATVSENIRLGRRDASDGEVQRAAEIAGADHFIRQLPQGYQTRLGREGGILSIGQRQCISIARAIIRRPRILILDEPTSALDPEIDWSVLNELRQAFRNQVIILISHRLSTIRHADQIVFMHDGRVIECGTHDDLMAHSNGSYRRFVVLQHKLLTRL